MSVVYASLLGAGDTSLIYPIQREATIRKGVCELISIRDNNRDSIYMYIFVCIFMLKNVFTLSIRSIKCTFYNVFFCKRYSCITSLLGDILNKTNRDVLEMYWMLSPGIA